MKELRIGLVLYGGIVMDAFVMFPFVDVVAFPLMTTAAVEDLIDIQEMRISPYDVEHSANNDAPLGGAALSGFAGFRDRDIREGDLRRGRLDGAQRLVTLIRNAAMDAGSSQEKNKNPLWVQIRLCALELTARPKHEPLRRFGPWD